MNKTAALAAALTLIATPVLAHPGHGLFNGLVHPGEELDLLIMTIAGIGITALIGYLFRRG
jgi:hydrogenase/urease accessory protein HupE